MSRFAGFPRRMQFTPVPDLFLNRLMAEIDEIAELKVTLHIFSLLYHKRGYPRCISFRELASCRPLIISLGEGAAITLEKALEAAARRGTILELKTGSPEGSVYFLNDPAGRESIDKVRRGELKLPGIEVQPPVEPGAKPPDIFTLYEENIGMLTPLIADDLRQAEKLYPAGWIEDAIKESVTHNKRNWRYITAILERWSREGRTDGAHRGDTKEDPDRFIRGRYGHMVRR